MDYNVQKIYDGLSIKNKRNELNKLLIKTDKLLDELLKKENIYNNPIVQNYNQNNTNNISESEMLSMIYSDVSLIKNKVLTLLVMETD